MYWVSMQSVSQETEKVEVIVPESNQSSTDQVEGTTGGKEQVGAGATAHETLTLFGFNNTTGTASTITPSQQVEPPKLPDSADQLLQVTLALALVVGLIYGVAWLIRRNKGFAPSAGIPMKTLSVLPMGVKEKIVLVEVGGKQLLLGMTPSNINTLATFDEPIVDPTLGNDKPFSSRLKDLLNQNKTVETKE